MMKKILRGKNMVKKSNKGITLIALVVTIIVLLLLAGISVQMLTGENGILQRAGEAKENTEQSQIEEQRRLASMEAAINITETTFQGVKIPKGFAPTRIEGESTVDEGLTIVDSIGNEYVWVEVPNDGSGPNYSGVENNNTISTSKIYTALLKYCEKDIYGNKLNSALVANTTYQTNDIWLDRNGKDSNSTSDVNDTEICGLTSEEYSKLFDKMLISVYKNGGFWLGRYEAGATIARNNKNDSIEEIKVLSQKNLYPINLVTCKQAQLLAKSVIKIENYCSSLLFGLQWDLVIKFLNNKGVDTSLLNANSVSWGNYTDASFNINRGELCLSIRTVCSYRELSLYKREIAMQNFHYWSF